MTVLIQLPICISPLLYFSLLYSLATLWLLRLLPTWCFAYAQLFTPTNATSLSLPLALLPLLTFQPLLILINGSTFTSLLILTFTFSYASHLYSLSTQLLTLILIYSSRSTFVCQLLLIRTFTYLETPSLPLSTNHLTLVLREFHVYCYSLSSPICVHKYGAFIKNQVSASN